MGGRYLNQQNGTSRIAGAISMNTNIPAAQILSAIGSAPACRLTAQRCSQYTIQMKNG